MRGRRRIAIPRLGGRWSKHGRMACHCCASPIPDRAYEKREVEREIEQQALDERVGGDTP